MFRWDVRVSQNHRYATATVLITSASVVMRPVWAKHFLFFCRIFCTGGRLGRLRLSVLVVENFRAE